MNPFFWILVVIFAVLIWLVLKKAFVMLGDAVIREYEETVEILNTEYKEEDECENQD